VKLRAAILAARLIQYVMPPCVIDSLGNNLKIAKPLERKTT
jgi:hypothetical protein